MIISYIITHISSTEYEIFVIFQSTPESTLFNRSGWNLKEARLQTLVYMCKKFIALSQFLHTKLASTKYPTSNGTDGQTDRQTDGPISLHFTGDNNFIKPLNIHYYLKEMLFLGNQHGSYQDSSNRSSSASVSVNPYWAYAVSQMPPQET